MKWNASIRNTRKEPQSQMILAHDAGRHSIGSARQDRFKLSSSEKYVLSCAGQRNKTTEMISVRCSRLRCAVIQSTLNPGPSTEEIIPMQRRDFLKSTVAVALAAELGTGKARAKVAAHNWTNYDFGSGPHVADRLNQGPFPQYPPDALIPTDDVVMTTTPSDDVVPNLWQGPGHLHHGRQWYRGNQVREYSPGDRRPGSISPGRAALYPSHLAGSTAPARAPGAARLREAGFRIGEKQQQAGRVPYTDVRSRLYTRSRPPGFCPR